MPPQSEAVDPQTLEIQATEAEAEAAEAETRTVQQNEDGSITVSLAYPMRPRSDTERDMPPQQDPAALTFGGPLYAKDYVKAQRSSCPEIAMVAMLAGVDEWLIERLHMRDWLVCLTAANMAAGK